MRIWRGLAWREAYPLAWMQQKGKTTFCDPSATGDVHVTGADWQIKAGVMELRLCLLALRLVNIKTCRVWAWSWKYDSVKKALDLRRMMWRRSAELTPLFVYGGLWCWLHFNQASSNAASWVSCCEIKLAVWMSEITSIVVGRLVCVF